MPFGMGILEKSVHTLGAVAGKMAAVLTHRQNGGAVRAREQHRRQNGDGGDQGQGFNSREPAGPGCFTRRCIFAGRGLLPAPRRQCRRAGSGYF